VRARSTTVLPLLALLALLALPLQLASADSTILPGTDMTGNDYRHFDLPKPRPRLCQEACFNDETCRAWTFLHEGLLGPLAVCWLKSGTPVPRQDSCCISGVK
jgi:hypothetical protein